MKRCPQCGESKEHSEFYKDASKHDNLSSMCKACKRKVAAAYYHAHKPERAAYALWYRRTYGY